MGAMKNFKHISVRHEIFLKIFDGPQNIFLCSPLVILICEIRESENKMSKLAIKEILKVRHVKEITSTQQVYMKWW